ncbi:9144_t:CDS:2, partial [Acaulospora colombiana]
IQVTFLKLRLASIYLNIRTDNSIVAMSFPEGFQITFSDVPTETAASGTSILLPSGRIQCLLSTSNDPDQWLEAAVGSFDIGMDIYTRPDDWKSLGEAQSRFIEEQDSMTRRVPFIYEKGTPVVSDRLWRGEKKPPLSARSSQTDQRKAELLLISMSSLDSSSIDESDEPKSGTESDGYYSEEDLIDISGVLVGISRDKSMPLNSNSRRLAIFRAQSPFLKSHIDLLGSSDTSA